MLPRQQARSSARKLLLLRAGARSPNGPPGPWMRSFRSYDHPSQSASALNDTEKSILAAAYKHVPQQGFTPEALRRGARDAGYLDVSPSVLVDGPFSLIRYHLILQREALAERSRQLFPEHGDRVDGVSAKVATLTWERLVSNKDVIHKWQEALAIMAQPSFIPISLKELALLSDEIWFLAGDTAVDSSWYTKRATLSTIYSTSELFMTNDQSPGFVETAQFLNRRLGDAKTLGGAISSAGQWAGFTWNATVNILRSKGVRI